MPSEADLLKADLLSKGYSGSVADGAYEYLQVKVGANRQKSYADQFSLYTGPKKGSALDDPLDSLGITIGDLPTGLDLWLDASVLAGVNDSDVSAWNDLSPFAAAFTQAVVANKPKLKTADLNGKNTVQFKPSASDTWLTTPRQSPDGPASVTVVAVMNLTSLTNVTPIGAAGAAGGFGIDFNSGSMRVMQEGVAQCGGTNSLSAVGLLVNTWFIIALKFDHAGSVTTKYWVHTQAGGLIANGLTKATTNPLGVTAATYCVGAYNGISSGNGLAGKLAELAVWTTLVSDANIATLISSLKTKWGL